jgi:HPt (histidine-containing phosphotransfer) domain-containing protein
MSLSEFDRTVPRRPARGRRPPIDHEHLARESGGNTDRRNNALRRFLLDATDGVDRIKRADTVETRAEAAGKLAAAAQSIGAFSVAYIASEIELAKGPVTGRLLALDRSVGEVRAEIAELLTQ